MGLPFDPPARLLMGPGPANAHPRVLAAQTFPLLGHMHPPYFKIMDEVQEGLRCGELDSLLSPFSLIYCTISTALQDMSSQQHGHDSVLSCCDFVAALHTEL